MSACVGPRPPVVAVFLGDGLVERRHPAAGLLQLRPQRLERGAVVLLQRREPLQHFRREGRAGIGRGLLDQPVQRIADVLGRVDGGGDQVLGFVRIVVVHCAPSSMRGARPISMSLKSIPCGGRAMRTRRPSRFQRQAQSRAAASPGSSPSASTITSRTSSRQIEGAQPGGRKRRPGRMAGRLHGGEAGLDAFADHQHVARLGKAHRAATAGAEHHLLRIDRRLAAAVAGEEGAVDRQRRSVRAARHQRHHRRPDAARGMLQTGMEAQRVGRRQIDAARGEIGLDQRSLCRLGGLPDGERGLAALGVVSIRLALDRRAARRARERARTVLGPQAARAQRRDDALLVAAGMAAHQHLAVVRVADRKARRAVVMRRAARRPAAAGLPPAEGLGDGFSGHGAPPRCRRRRACRCRSPGTASRPATTRRGPRRSR